MGWIRRIMQRLAEDLSGARLDMRRFYEVTAPGDPAEFLLALDAWLPPDCRLYFEENSMTDELRALVERHRAPSPLKMAHGTIFPRPREHHVVPAPGVVPEIAAIAGRVAKPEICDHFHIYRGSEVLLQWHDAWFTDPFLLAGSFAEAEVTRLCGLLGCRYEVRGE